MRKRTYPAATAKIAAAAVERIYFAGSSYKVALGLVRAMLARP